MTAAAGGIPERPSRVDSKTSEKFSKSTQRIKQTARRGQNVMLNVEKGRCKAKQIGSTGAKPLKSAR